MKLTESIVAGINSDDAEAFVAASEVARAFMFGTEDHVGLESPYDLLIRNSPPKPEDIEIISKTIVAYVLDGSGDNIGAAVWVLGKIQDNNLIPLLREQSHNHFLKLLNQAGIVGNLICALSDHGEKIISADSYGFDEVDKNIRDARSYLKKFGITV